MFEVGGELEPEVIEDSCWVGPICCCPVLCPSVDNILDFQCFKLVALIVTFMFWTKKMSFLYGF